MSHETLPSTLFIMLHFQVKMFEDDTSNILGADRLVKVKQNVAQYPLNHVIYSGTNFDVATSNSLGGDALTRKYII